MSVGYKAYKYIEEMLEVTGKPIKGLRICCMGHLNTKRDTRDYFRSRGHSGNVLLGSYLKDRGADVIELDLNHKNCALPIDLGRIITDKSLVGTFDLIIDGGTAEHIDNQQAFWENDFNLLKIGGISIHMHPYKNSWPVHATWRYDFNWLDTFIKLLKYQIVDVRKQSDEYWFHNFERMIISWTMKKMPDSKFEKFPDPYFDPQGNMKDKRMYDRFVLPARKK